MHIYDMDWTTTLISVGEITPGLVSVMIVTEVAILLVVE
jgi:hypothetical protein